MASLARREAATRERKKERRKRERKERKEEKRGRRKKEGDSRELAWIPLDFWAILGVLR